MDTPRQNPMDAETLAALLDGKLSEVDAAMVRDQLSHADQDTIDAYMDAVAVNSLLGEETLVESVPVESHVNVRVRQSSRWWVGVSAVGLAAAAAFAVFFRARSANDGFAPKMYATTLASHASAGDLSTISAVRGNGSSPTERIRAIRTGILLTEIEFGVQNRRNVTSELKQVSALLREIPGANALAATYESFAVNPSLLEDVHQRSTAGNESMIAVGQSLATAGAYLQAAAIASRANDQAFFRKFSGEQLRPVSEMKELPDSLRSSVVGLMAQIEQRPLDLKMISVSIDAVLRSLAN